MNDGSGMIKMAAQDIYCVLSPVPVHEFQMPAAAVIRRLRNVDVFA